MCRSEGVWTIQARAVYAVLLEAARAGAPIEWARLAPILEGVSA
jgi:hypothetical protein